MGPNLFHSQSEKGWIQDASQPAYCEALKAKSDFLQIPLVLKERCKIYN